MRQLKGRSHLRVQGRSVDVSNEHLNLSSNATDDEVRRQVARYLDMPLRDIQRYVVDRPAEGDFVVRPPAVFG